MYIYINYAVLSKIKLKYYLAKCKVQIQYRIKSLAINFVLHQKPFRVRLSMEIHAFEI